GLRPRHEDHGDDLSFTTHRNADESSKPEVAREPPGQFGWVFLGVRNVDHSSVEDGALGSVTTGWSVGKHASEAVIGLGIRARDRRQVHELAVEPSDGTTVRVEEPDGAPADRL